MKGAHMADEAHKLKHSERRHKTIAKKVKEKKLDIKHSHHTDNPRRLIDEETIQEKRLKQDKLI